MKMIKDTINNNLSLIHIAKKRNEKIHVIIKSSFLLYFISISVSALISLVFTLSSIIRNVRQKTIVNIPAKKSL
jgi:hypothetical protein